MTQHQSLEAAKSTATAQASKALAGARPVFPEADIELALQQIAETLRGGRLILGPRTREFEALCIEQFGTKYAVAVSSCTAALEIALRYRGVAGSEVIVPTNTFVATANAAINAGASVVFADMDPADYSIDVDDAMSKFSSKTAALVVVHIAGFVARGIERLRTECQNRNVMLIEDCAHAHGASYQGRRAGALGDVGCFSLYPTKILTSCTGGFLTTNDAELDAYARSLRHHGQGSSLEAIENAGNDWLMDEVRAILATTQLRRLDEFLGIRRAIAARYDELLAGDERVILPQPLEGSTPAYYKYPVLLPAEVDREDVRAKLSAEYQIECGAIYSPPCHQMPVFRKLPGLSALPKAEQTLHRQLCLPMHAGLVAADADRGVAALDQVLRAYG